MRLIIEDDSGRRTVVPFTADDISIGRERGNTVCLDQRNISRRHAILSRREGQVILEDLGSSNGVSINGERVRGKRQVGEADIIQIGDYDLALEDETKSALPERPTQPEMASSSATPASDPDEEARDQLEALARMQKAAALQATLTQARLSQSTSSSKADLKPRSERDTDPKRDAAGSETPWPPEFHRFEPNILAAAAASARRRRLAFAALAVILATVGVAYILQSRPDRHHQEPQAAALAPAAAHPPIVAPLPERAPESIVAPVAVPQAIPPAPEAPHPSPLVVKPAPTILPAPNARASRAAAREKAHDLYQDAVADVGNGDLPAAVSKLQEALRIDSALPEAHKELGICYSRLKQPAKGAYQYERYLELAPQAPDADDVRKMLRDYQAAKSQ